MEVCVRNWDRFNGPMLEFEIAGDRNNFIDLKENFLEIKCKIVQSSDADLKYDNAAAADVTKTDAPCFCNNVLHSLFLIVQYRLAV